MGTKTFTTSDGFFTWTVKTEFFEKCPNPETFESWDLLNQYDIVKFLHNEIGPALIDHKSGANEFWINGKVVSDEMAKEIMHNTKFNEKLETLLVE